MSDAAAPAPQLVGKKLGVLLSVTPAHSNFRPAVALMNGALDAGVRVYLYCIDEGVRAVGSPEIQAIIWVDTDGKVEWVAPNESTAVFVGEQLTGERLAALQKALRVRTEVVSADYRDATQRPAHDIILPVQRGSADLGAFIAVESIEALLRTTLPTVFTTRYSLTVVDAQNREVLSNSSVKPTDRQVSGQIRRIHLPQRGGIDEVRMTRHDFAEGGFPAVPGVIPQQLGVGLFLHFTIKQPRREKSDKVFSLNRDRQRVFI